MESPRLFPKQVGVLTGMSGDKRSRQAGVARNEFTDNFEADCLHCVHGRLNHCAEGSLG